MKWLKGVLLTATLLALTMVSVDAQQDVTLSKHTQAELAYDAGSELYAAGKFRDAGVLFLKADLLAPSAAALLMAHRCYLRVGDKSMADKLNKTFQFRYSDKRLADVTRKEGIVCVTTDELEVLKARLSADAKMVDDMLRGFSLGKIPKNPY
jgi:hypothetical protein